LGIQIPKSKFQNPNSKIQGRLIKKASLFVFFATNGTNKGTNRGMNLSLVDKKRLLRIIYTIFKLAIGFFSFFATNGTNRGTNPPKADKKRHESFFGGQEKAVINYSYNFLN
jgi:hypothetical protein